MCFGRYDSRTHQLSDYHPSGSGTVWPGQDYSNPRIKDFTNGEFFLFCFVAIFQKYISRDQIVLRFSIFTYSSLPF